MTSHPVAPTVRWWALGFVLAGYLSVFAGATIMNVALPVAQADLGLGDSMRQWVVTLYALCFGALMVPAGRLGDLIGLRRCFAIGVTGFAAASLVGGLAWNVPALLVGRALQGAAGGLVAATGLALLSVMFPSGPDRPRAFGVLGTVMGLGTAGSFVVAGALVDGASWRWCLLINIPIAIVVVVGLTRTAPAGTRARGARLDLVGAVLVTAALALLVTGFDRAGVLGWASAVTVALLAAGLCLLLVLACWSRRTSDPLIPPALVADRHRTAAFVAVFLVGIGMFAGMFLLTTYLQGLLGYSALLTGLAFLPFGGTAMLASRLLRSVTGRVPAHVLLGAGLLLAAAALGVFAVLDPSAGYLGVLPVMVLLGAGGTVVMVTASGLATLGAGSYSGVAGALVNSSQQVGAALGTALLTAVAAAATSGRVASGADAVAASLHGYGVTGAVGAGLLGIGAAAVLLLGPRGSAGPGAVTGAGRVAGRAPERGGRGQ